jgi:dephospho-CoA kinase
MKDSLIIGLTGGIASGKSTVSKFFSNLSIPIIDADQISHDLTKINGSAYSEVIEYFGENITGENGDIDRKILGTIVFNSKSKKEKLESIIHPKVLSTIQAEIKSRRGEYKIIEVPLLIESGFQEFTNRILVVDCSTETQIERLMKRDGVTEEYAKNILSNQIDRETRLKFANEIVINEKNNSLLKLEDQVKKIHNFYLDLIRTYKK